jgi:hypothetical protein
MITSQRDYQYEYDWDCDSGIVASYDGSDVSEEESEPLRLPTQKIEGRPQLLVSLAEPPEEVVKSSLRQSQLRHFPRARRYMIPPLSPTWGFRMHFRTQWLAL